MSLFLNIYGYSFGFLTKLNESKIIRLIVTTTTKTTKTTTAARTITTIITIVVAARWPFLLNCSQKATIQGRFAGKTSPKIKKRISNNIYRGEYLAVQKKSDLKIYYNNSVIFLDIGILNRFNFEMVAIHLLSVTAALSSTYLQFSKFYYILLDSCYFPVFYCY